MDEKYNLFNSCAHISTIVPSFVPHSYAATVSIYGLHGQLLASLGPAIVAGEWPPGTVLRLEELEQRFGMSRTVVREAFECSSRCGWHRQSS